MAKASIKKAESLLMANLQADKNEDKIIGEWEKKRARAKTAQEKARIDKTYGQRVDQEEKKGNKAYKAYYDYIHDNFQKSEIENAVKATGNFTKKSFLRKLFGKPAPKKTTAKPKAKPTAKKATKPKATKPAPKKSTAKTKTKTATKRKSK